MHDHLYLLAFLLLAFPATARAADQPPPNFVFFITDDISAEDMETYGGPIPTPNLDRLAARGVTFDNAYVTASSCSPSRCSIITGRYPHNTGAPELHTPLPRDQWKFPGRLRRSGYHSVLSGKNHMSYNGVQEDESNLADAFDRILRGGRPSGSEDWVKTLRNRPKDQPFFFWFASHDAHRAWQLNEKAPRFETQDVVVPPYLVDGPKTRQDFRGYYHEVARTDFYLGLLLDELADEGITDNTFVIFTSDNGRPFPRCKTRLYDSGAKVPLVIAGPGVAMSKRSASLASLIDIAPTVLELAGVAIAEQFQGVSLLPILRDPDSTVRDYLFAEHNWHTYPANERMVRFENWTYIRNHNHEDQNLCAESADRFPAGAELWEAEANGLLASQQRDVFLKPRPFEELYDVQADPDQFNNLADSPEHSEILAELRDVMDRWCEQTGDSIPSKPTAVIGNITPGRRGEFPGASNDASHRLHPGPILRKAN
ncbi:sulfatase family protein [Allorhodopirellula solitaria]|uniref:Arylsulfatase n=1 Tax=Allorhodopirellula solitaria TaxID=2527987 RepID=A0A5C5WX10_9BACT|nr:sulfatase [Allorhodopirellula solitaria]TWT55494.1 Arylsulfatase [Allorhodopirellula solitaria]